MSARVCLGGTFNIIHDGHLALLRKALELGDEIYIGLTTDTMASKSRKVPLQDYELRKQNLEIELAKMAGSKKIFIFPLDDPMGRAATGNFEYIVVSQETLRGAEKINVVRERRGLKPLEIVVIDMVLASDGKPLSSTRVIRGEVKPKANNS